jgi:hypothetical protein
LRWFGNCGLRCCVGSIWVVSQKLQSSAPASRRPHRKSPLKDMTSPRAPSAPSPATHPITRRLHPRFIRLLRPCPQICHNSNQTRSNPSKNNLTRKPKHARPRKPTYKMITRALRVSATNPKVARVCCCGGRLQNAGAGEGYLLYWKRGFMEPANHNNTTCAIS